MIADLEAVMWKEWKSLFRARENRFRAFLSLLVPIGVFAIYVPWDSGSHWFEGSPSVFAAIILPVIVALLVMPDAFAGERERHTLPTLLASRLPDRAILFGKALFGITLGYGMALLVLALGLVTANLARWGEGFRFYEPMILQTDLVVGLLVAVLGVLAGTLVSLRSATVQEAQQFMTAVLLLPPTILGPIVLLVGRARPEWSLRRLLDDIDSTTLFLDVSAALVVVNCLLLLWAMARFKRARLM